MINIIGHRRVFLTISTILVIASIIAIAVFGLRQGIDFIGGSLWQVKFDNSASVPVKEEIQKIIPDAVIVLDNTTNSYLIRMAEVTEENHQELTETFKKEIGEFEELRFESIGPTIGRELRTRSLWAFVLVLLAISLYIAFAFRKVSYPVKSWKYGIVTLITLFHDAIIPIGLIAVLGRFSNLEVGVDMMVAILVIMGFSVHDTIVVLDRTRENLKQAKGDVAFTELINRSVNQTLARSINTSLTLLFILVALFFWGPTSLSYFALVILVGTIIGTYSSIFIASSLIAAWSGRE